MQNITIAGNVGQTPELKQVNGKSVLNFSVAVNTKPKGEEKTTWYRVSLWERSATALAPYIQRGTKVCVAGELDVREYNGKTYLEIPFARVTLMGTKPSGDKRPTIAEPATHEGDIPATHESDDIPF